MIIMSKDLWRLWLAKGNKKLSCLKETVRLLRESVLAKYNWETIFADIIGISSITVT